MNQRYGGYFVDDNAHPEVLQIIDILNRYNIHVKWGDYVDWSNGFVIVHYYNPKLLRWPIPAIDNIPELEILGMASDYDGCLIVGLRIKTKNVTDSPIEPDVPAE